MITNLTQQAAVSHSFMKEIREVLGDLKYNKVEVQEYFEKEVDEDVEEDVEEEVEEEVELKLSSSHDDTNSKLLELERNIAMVSIISIGMEPTANRIDEYIERTRRDRKRILNHLEECSVNKEVTNNITEETIKEACEISKDEEDEDDGLILEPHSIVDDIVLENDIIKLTNFKSNVEEEVHEVLENIPIIKSKKKRRGRPKKKA